MIRRWEKEGGKKSVIVARLAEVDIRTESVADIQNTEQRVELKMLSVRETKEGEKEEREDRQNNDISLSLSFHTHYRQSPSLSPAFADQYHLALFSLFSFLILRRNGAQAQGTE